MTKVLKLVLFFCLLLVCDTKIDAQDIGFSQFYDQPLLRNPALAGIFNGDVRFTASYRNQWQTVTIPYRTFGLSTEIKFPLQVMNLDVTGTFGLEISGMLPVHQNLVPHKFYRLEILVCELVTTHFYQAVLWLALCNIGSILPSLF